MPRPKIALILGAGFSCEAGLPTTKEVAKRFLQSQANGHLPPQLEEEISNQLKQFWKYTFNYEDQEETPSLEDHFTVLDLAANAGRNIGAEYMPKKLRAIRRLSIHRIFQILNRYGHSLVIQSLLSSLTRTANTTIISTNWDRVVENHLQVLAVPYWYGTQVENLAGIETPSMGTELLMLHGSANWIYCDSCRRLYAEEFGKSALDTFIYITTNDFELLCAKNKKKEIVKCVESLSRRNKLCPHCRSRLSARIGTFSYRKEISIPQFQTIWQKAFETLRDCDTWLFIGYSLPDADFEFRHLLKSAEKSASGNRGKNIQVILKCDEDAAKRFKRFLGIRDEQIYINGLSSWVNERLPGWLTPAVSEPQSQSGNPE
jgi:NAD-dependent SIR2 family protein deacetylase